MNRFVIFSLILGVCCIGTFAGKVKLMSCEDGTPMMEYLDIEGCSGSRCVVRGNARTNVKFAYKLANPVKSLEPFATAYWGDTDFPINLPRHHQNMCKSVGGCHHPAHKDTKVAEMHFEIPKVPFAFDVTVKFHTEDSLFHRMGCVKFYATVKP